MHKTSKVRRRIAALIAACLCDLFCNEAHAVDYKLSLVAKVGDTIGGKTLTGLADPTINNAGQITFAGVYSGGIGLFTPNSVVVKSGDIVAGKSIEIIDQFAVNDLGDVAFGATYSDGIGVFANDMLIAKPGDSIGGLTITGWAQVHPSINNHGTVAFVAGISGGHAVFTQHGVVATPFTVVEGSALTAILPGHVDIYDSNEVLFKAEIGGSTGVFTQARRIWVGAGPTGATWVGMTENGDVGVTIAAERILVDDVEVLSEPSSIDGLAVSNFNSESLNDFGTVAFSAVIAPIGGRGIFTPTDKVAGPGSIVDGRLLSSSSNSVINNSGDIVFVGEFLDRTHAVILATPIAAGDYNGNGTVDAADYIVWRKTLGDTGSSLAADGNSNRRVDTADYEVWKLNFGKSLAGQGDSQTAVPEPSATALTAFAICALSFKTRRIA